MPEAKQTLCWDCKNSTTKNCDWAANYEPVDGWNAEERKGGWFVYECPLFKRDSWGLGAYRTKEEYERVIANRRIRNEQADDYRKPDERPGTACDEWRFERVHVYGGCEPEKER